MTKHVIFFKKTSPAWYKIEFSKNILTSNELKQFDFTEEDDMYVKRIHRITHKELLCFIQKFIEIGFNLKDKNEIFSDFFYLERSYTNTFETIDYNIEGHDGLTINIIKKITNEIYN